MKYILLMVVFFLAGCNQGAPEVPVDDRIQKKLRTYFLQVLDNPAGYEPLSTTSFVPGKRDAGGWVSDTIFHRFNGPTKNGGSSEFNWGFDVRVHKTGEVLLFPLQHQ